MSALATTTTGKKQPAGLSSAYQRFAYIVARGSGLDYHVVEAWLLAEGGPNDNPLNIGPGRHYGSVDNAASATLKQLRAPQYAGIRKAVKGSPSDQISAIAASPWDAGHYRGAGGNQGSLLRGTFARVSGNPPPKISGTTIGIPGGPSVHVGSIGGALGGALGDVEQFVLKESVVALGYVVLMAAAVALFVLGLLRATGQSPADLAGGSLGRAAAKGEIPF